MGKIIDEYGPQAILPFSYLGNQGLVHGLNGGDSFLINLGLPYVKELFVEKALVLLGFPRLGLQLVLILKVTFTANI